MNTYNVYFTPKEEIDHNHLLELAHRFATFLQEQGLIQSYNLSRITSPGNFEAMPQYTMAVSFSSAQAMEQSFSEIRKSHMHRFPHSELMQSVSDFKVTFSEACRA
ncbi:DUF6614 family protein [Marinimicrobium sp. C2-29]|uniref:DUF6614 family protein n=1 Tax=Marinimicrobium sp. C2-29 TaxID=3139825 RepID=UPI003138D358